MLESWELLARINTTAKMHMSFYKTLGPVLKKYGNHLIETQEQHKLQRNRLPSLSCNRTLPLSLLGTIRHLLVTKLLQGKCALFKRRTEHTSPYLKVNRTCPRAFQQGLCLEFSFNLNLKKSYPRKDSRSNHFVTGFLILSEINTSIFFLLKILIWLSYFQKH